MAGFNKFGAIAAKLKPALQKAAKESARTMAENIRSEAPVRTGFLAGSVYFSAFDESSYGQGMGPTESGSYLLPKSTPPDDMTVIVDAAANYAIYINCGTRFIPANPFFDRGVEASRSTLEPDMAVILNEELQ
ncbi:MAG: HK97 gp10 family phage protein [Ktedonobacteraceae bacterium]